MPDYSRKADLQAAVIRALGLRSASEPLKAVAYSKETNTFWALKQDGFLNDDELARLRKELGTEKVYHAWVNNCDMDWTLTAGLHVRFIAVSARLERMGLPSGGRDLTAAANCHCIVSCALETEQLPVDDPESESGAEQADWWAFMREIPSAASLVASPQGRARATVSH